MFGYILLVCCQECNINRSQEKYEAAEPLYKEAIEIDKFALPPNHLSLARDFNNLAKLYSYQERYETAEPFFQQALDILEQKLGREHPLTIKV